MTWPQAFSKSVQFGILHLLLLLLVAGCGSSEMPKQEAQSRAQVRAKVQVISKSMVPGTFTVPGTIKSKFNATLSSKVMGRITEVRVREGDVVKQGQLLVSIDSRELEASAEIASANYHSSIAGVSSAKTAAAMEQKTSVARIAQVESQVNQAEAALASAEARRDLALAGPRKQEVDQSHIAVVQAESTLKFAKLELDRTKRLVESGALARRDLDLAQNRYDLAKGQYDNAVQNENMAREGSREQEIRASREAVSQAVAALNQAKAGVVQAKASAMQVDVRLKEIEVAKAGVDQSAAVAKSAKVSLAYARVVAPFDGRIVKRIVDPGSMASSGVPLLEIEGGESLLEVVVPEGNMKFVHFGTRARLDLEAAASTSLSGTVIEIVPQGDASSHSYLVKFSLEPRLAVRSGGFGRAIIYAESTEKIAIPVSATWEKDGLHYVYVVDQANVARLRIVTVGPANGALVEVLSGLGIGERIVVNNLSQVSDGSKVVGD